MRIIPKSVVEAVKLINRSKNKLNGKISWGAKHTLYMSNYYKINVV